MKKIKQLLNKYVYIVVIVIALLIAGTYYLIVPLFINQKLNVITVPVAVERIPEATRITSEMYQEMEIIDGYLPNNVITDSTKLNGLYVKKGTMIAKDGFFYVDYLANEEQTLGTIYTNLEDGEYAYNLQTSERWVTNDNISVGQYINLYVSFNYLSMDDDIAKANNIEQINSVFGQLLENVRVIAMSEDRTIITLACKEEQIGKIRLAEHFINNARISSVMEGEIIPMTYFDSNLTLNYETQYFDMNQTEDWIMEKSQELKNIEIEVEEDEESMAVAEEDVVQEGGGIEE